jgi:hypothetical protein
VFVPHGVETSTPLRLALPSTSPLWRISRTAADPSLSFSVLPSLKKNLYRCDPAVWNHAAGRMFGDRVVSKSRKYLASRTFTASYPILHSQVCSLASTIEAASRPLSSRILLHSTDEGTNNRISASLIVYFGKVGIIKNNQKNNYQKLKSEYLAEYSMYGARSGIKWIGRISRII